MRLVYSYTQLESLDDRFKDLVNNGIYKGGLISLEMGLVLKVLNFKAMFDGVTILEDADTSFKASVGVQYLILKVTKSVEYSAQVLLVTAAQLPSYSDYLIFAKLDVPSGTTSLATSMIDYSVRSNLNPLGKGRFIGVFNTIGEFPSSATDGDYGILISNDTAHFRIRLNNAWFNTTNYDSAIQSLNNHAGNSNLHITASLKDALVPYDDIESVPNSNPAIDTPAGAGNRVVFENDPRLINKDQRDAMAGNLESVPPSSSNKFLVEKTPAPIRLIFDPTPIYSETNSSGGFTPTYLRIKIGSGSPLINGVYVGDKGNNARSFFSVIDIDGKGVSKDSVGIAVEEVYTSITDSKEPGTTIKDNANIATEGSDKGFFYADGAYLYLKLNVQLKSGVDNAIASAIKLKCFKKGFLSELDAQTLAESNESSYKKVLLQEADTLNITDSLTVSDFFKVWATKNAGVINTRRLSLGIAGGNVLSWDNGLFLDYDSTHLKLKLDAVNKLQLSKDNYLFALNEAKLTFGNGTIDSLATALRTDLHKSGLDVVEADAITTVTLRQILVREDADTLVQMLVEDSFARHDVIFTANNYISMVASGSQTILQIKQGDNTRVDHEAGQSKYLYNFSRLVTSARSVKMGLEDGSGFHTKYELKLNNADYAEVYLWGDSDERTRISAGSVWNVGNYTRVFIDKNELRSAYVGDRSNKEDYNTDSIYWSVKTEESSIGWRTIHWLHSINPNKAYSWWQATDLCITTVDNSNNATTRSLLEAGKLWLFKVAGNYDNYSYIDFDDIYIRAKALSGSGAEEIKIDRYGFSAINSGGRRSALSAFGVGFYEGTGPGTVVHAQLNNSGLNFGKGDLDVKCAAFKLGVGTVARLESTAIPATATILSVEYRRAVSGSYPHSTTVESKILESIIAPNGDARKLYVKDGVWQIPVIWHSATSYEITCIVWYAD